MKKGVALLLAGIIGFMLGAGALFITLRLCDNNTLNAALGVTGTETATSGVSSQELTALAYEAAGYLKNRDYTSLSGLVHPVYGVVFSPSSEIDLRTARCFTPQQLIKLDSDSAKYIWGLDGETPIELTPEDYIASYAYDRDYVSAPTVGIDRVIRNGNSLDNLSQCFPDGRFVDLCFPGTKDNEFCDWSSLRLVFENHEGVLKLTAIIHSEYTI